MERSVPIQPKTSEMLPKFCQFAKTARVESPTVKKRSSVLGVVGGTPWNHSYVTVSSMFAQGIVGAGVGDAVGNSVGV